MRLLRAGLVALASAVAACGSAPPRPAVDPHAVPDAVPDAVPRAEPRAARGNPPFYDVMGRRYVVLATAEGHVEQGVASWYGPDFHGKSTSTGEPYDMYSMTAAHPTLPLPAYVRVTNLQNGRSVVVRVNDRGPFKKNRIIDLSYAAALRLDMVRDGTALVEVRAVMPGGGAPAAPPVPAGFYAQAGAFGDEGNARRLGERLAAAGLAGVTVMPANVEGRALHRVRVGPVATVAEFDALVERLRGLGIPDARLAVN
jgi:rare lipoprotein A